eukprot:scaffold29452_cov37-Cyclotella_meneghiniana.AAC.3
MQRQGTHNDPFDLIQRHPRTIGDILKVQRPFECGPFKYHIHQCQQCNFLLYRRFYPRSQRGLHCNRLGVLPHRRLKFNDVAVSAAFQQRNEILTFGATQGMQQRRGDNFSKVKYPLPR